MLYVWLSVARSHVADGVLTAASAVQQPERACNLARKFAADVAVVNTAIGV